MENQEFKHWSIDICENINEPKEITEVDGENLALLKRGIRRYGQPIEDNSIRPAAGLSSEEVDGIKQILAPEKTKTILDISQEFRKTADKIYENNGLPFGYKSYFYIKDGLGKIEFYPIDSKNFEKFKKYSDIPAQNIVKLLNFPLVSPLYLAAKLHDLAFDIEYYANLEPTPFVQRTLLEIGIKAGKLERDINDEFTPHFDTMDLNKGKGRSVTEMFDAGLSINKRKKKGGNNRGLAIKIDSDSHHKIILRVFEKYGQELRFGSKLKTGEFIIKRLPKGKELRDARRVYEVLQKFYTFDSIAKMWSKIVT